MILGFPGGNYKDFFYNIELQIFFRLPERKFKAFPHNIDIHVLVTYNNTLVNAFELPKNENGKDSNFHVTRPGFKGCPKIPILQFF